jgi:uncharacterized protein (TIGR03089 family)
VAPAAPPTPPLQLDALARADGGAPLITQYDGGTGARVELSRATAANWVAKTGNLLLDELGLEPGAAAAVLLPLHWQAVTSLLACWRVGVRTRLVGPGAEIPGDAAVLLAPAERLAEARAVAGAAELVGFSLHPLGAPLPPAVAAGVTDFATAVLGCADQPPPAVASEAPAHDDGSGRVRTGAELAVRGAAWAREHDLTAADRLLSTVELGRPDGLAAAVLAPLAAGSSAVLITGDPGAAAGRLPGWAGQERVSATVGAALPGRRRIG